MEAENVEYRATRRIAGRGPTRFQFHHALRGLAVDREGQVHAVGDSVCRVYGAEGDVIREWSTARPGECVAVDGIGRVWVGEKEQVEIFDPSGDLLDTWRDPGRLGLVTAIGFGETDVFLADATARWVHRYDSKGRRLNSIGDRHRKGGFHIPNGVVDFSVDVDGTLRVANPGMHRVERYAPDGTLLGRFGHFDGQDPAGFPGCCNPTNLAVDDSGRVIVTEKAGPRLKVYSAEGELLALVADDAFDPSAKNMDVAVDGSGRIYVADTATLLIHVFEPINGEAEA